MRIRVVLSALAVMACATTSVAHHSFSMFDAEKTATIEGTVQEFEYVNPHAWLHINTTDASGKTQLWSIEMAGLNALVRTGWTADTVKPGDRISVQIHPLKDGSRGGQYLQAKFPDGRTMDGGDAGLPPIAR